MLVREVRREEYGRAGAVILASYRALDGYVSEPDYERELADVATRAAVAEVAVAVGGGGQVVGCITYVPDPSNPYAEFDDEAASGFRMLGVDPELQGGGAGRALVQWCVERAVVDGKQRIFIHSTPWMVRAHGLYERMGFERRPDLDWVPVPDIQLLGFVLELPR